MTTARPHGRDEIVTALLEACERLCSTIPPSLVTVRGVALEASVTPGLVHHYFESKDALIGATLLAIARDGDAAAAAAWEATRNPGEMVRAVWRLFQERPAFAYIVAWWLLEGRNVTEAMGDHPFIRRLVLALEATGDPDPATHAAVITTMLVAGTAFRSGFNRATGRPTGDPVFTGRMERTLVVLTNATDDEEAKADDAPARRWTTDQQAR